MSHARITFAVTQRFLLHPRHAASQVEVDRCAACANGYYRPDEDADSETVVLEVGGAVVRSRPGAGHNGLMLVPIHVVQPGWPAQRHRSPSAPEDCVAIGDPTATPLPLAAARLTVLDETWVIDPAVPVDDSWHGAVVVARSDGFVVGILLVDDGQAIVVLIPSSFTP